MGTHPIFESDFDCLTDKSRTMVSKKSKTTDQASTRVSLLSSNPENTTSDTERPSSNSDRAKLNWFFWLTTPLSSDDLRSNITLCSLKPEFTITTDPTSSSEPLAVNISVSDV